jgi:hypothetical protein
MEFLLDKENQAAAQVWTFSFQLSRLRCYLQRRWSLYRDIEVLAVFLIDTIFRILSQ